MLSLQQLVRVPSECFDYLACIGVRESGKFQPILHMAIIDFASIISSKKVTFSWTEAALLF